MRSEKQILRFYFGRQKYVFLPDIKLSTVLQSCTPVAIIVLQCSSLTASYENAHEEYTGRILKQCSNNLIACVRQQRREMGH